MTDDKVVSLGADYTPPIKVDKDLSQKVTDLLNYVMTEFQGDPYIVALGALDFVQSEIRSYHKMLAMQHAYDESLFDEEPEE